MAGNRKDPGWKYNYLKDPNDPTRVTCNYCGKTTTGGINRAKQHLIGNFRNTTKCPKCPEEVREELKAYMEEKKKKNEVYKDDDEFNYQEDVGGEEEVQEIMPKKRGLGNFPSGPSKKLTQGKGPMQVFLQKQGTLRQTNIKDSCDKEARGVAIQKIARFFYDAAIPFNVANLKSFKEAIEAVGRYGPNLKPPSYHELRVPLLKKEVELTKEMVSRHVEEWKKYGCSIMADGWKDRKQRTLINFLVNSPYGTVFLDSVDASSFVKTGEKLCELLDRYVERVGEQNVVQVISDNGSNFVLAGKLLQNKRKHLYWTPCAAHCVDLMLEDIGKIPNIKKTLERAISLVGFIYGNPGVINLMRDFTKNKELVKCGVTRFATSFLTLQRLHCQKNNLRAMFTSERWVTSRWSKTPKGKNVATYVMLPAFWNKIIYILKIMGPLVKVLRLADNEKKPAMGYIYEAMDRAKEAISKAFDYNVAKYNDIFKIIDERWECQLHHPLHAAGHFLNPEFFYKDVAIQNCKEVTDGLLACIEKLVPSVEVQDKIMSEISVYTRAEGQFDRPIAKRSRAQISPVEWWNLYGNSTPHLQKLAIRVLGLTASSAGCERNWSVFEHIHTKKRNKLEHRRLNDLAYVKYNRALKARFDVRNVIDPVSLDYIDHSNEWLIGEMGDHANAEDELVFEDDNLTWGDVARASGSEDLQTYTRRQKKQGEASTSRAPRVNIENDIDFDELEDEQTYTRRQKRHGEASTSRAPRVSIENDIDFDESEDEEIEGYHSSDGNESNFIEEEDEGDDYDS